MKGPVVDGTAGEGQRPMEVVAKRRRRAMGAGRGLGAGGWEGRGAGRTATEAWSP